MRDHIKYIVVAVLPKKQCSESSAEQAEGVLFVVVVPEISVVSPDQKPPLPTYHTGLQRRFL
jgi:hypothetical protein